MKDVLSVLKGAKAVIHSAAVVDLRDDSKARTLMHNVNVGGTWNIIRGCIHFGIEYLVYTSSARCLKTYPVDELQDEVAFERRLKSTQPTTGYSKTKFDATNLVIAASKKYGFKASLLVPSVVFGPGDIRYTEGIILNKEYMCSPKKSLQSYANVVNLGKAHGLAVQAMMKKPDQYLVPQIYLIGDFNEDMRKFHSTLCSVHGLDPKSKKNMWPYIDL